MATSALRVLVVFPGSLFGGSWAAGPRVKPELVSVTSFVRRRGHTVGVVDLEAEIGAPAEGGQEAYLRRAEELLAGWRPDLIAVDCRTSLQYTAAVALAERLRRLYPAAVIAVTGYHPTARPDDFTYEGSPVNWILVGDPETALAEVADAVAGGDRDTQTCRALEGTPLVLDEEAVPDYDGYRYAEGGQPKLSVYLSRGCPYHAAACMLRPGGRGWTAYPPAVALRLLDELAARGPGEVEVLDPAFGFDGAWRTAVLAKLAETYRRAVPLTVCSRPDALTRADIDRLYHGSVGLRLSIETLSAELLERTGAAPHPRRAVDHALDLLAYTNAKGVPTTVQLAFNQPGETRATAADTLARLEELTAGQPNTSLRLRADSWAYFPTSEPAADVDTPAVRYGMRIVHDGWWRDPVASEAAAKAVVASEDLADLAPGDDSYWRPRFEALRAVCEERLTAEARRGLRSHESVGSGATDVPHGWWVEGRWH